MTDTRETVGDSFWSKSWRAAVLALVGLALTGRGAGAADTVWALWGAGSGATAELYVYPSGAGAIELHTGSGASTVGLGYVALDAWRQTYLQNPRIHVPSCLFGAGMGWSRTSVAWPLNTNFQVSGVGQLDVYFTWSTDVPLLDHTEYWIQFQCAQ